MQLCKVSKELEALHDRKYTACKVYVIFEKEEAQRACLKALTTGSYPLLPVTALLLPHRPSGLLLPAVTYCIAEFEMQRGESHESLAA